MSQSPSLPPDTTPSATGSATGLPRGDGFKSGHAGITPEQSIGAFEEFLGPLTQGQREELVAIMRVRDEYAAAAAAGAGVCPCVRKAVAVLDAHLHAQQRAMRSRAIGMAGELLTIIAALDFDVEGRPPLDAPSAGGAS